MKTEKRSTSEFQDDYEKLQEAEAFRRLAFFGVFVATCAILVGIVAVPVLYGYLQRVHTALQIEADYCKSATGTLMRQVAQAQVQKGVIRADALQASGSLDEMMTRHKRSYGSDAGVNAHAGGAMAPAAAPVFSHNDIAQTCSCRIGPAGEAGAPGSDGSDGSDGQPGSDGHPGADAEANAVPTAADFCFKCEDAPAGPPGNAGPKGPSGNPGAAGQPGAPGNGGGKGPTGPPGPPGQNGNPGADGTPGAPGQVQDVPGIPGPAGPAGPAGAPGQPGQPGPDGHPGNAGPQGPPGDAGADGARGNNGEDGDHGADGEQGNGGDCSHCPPPRTAPGQLAPGLPFSVAREITGRVQVLQPGFDLIPAALVTLYITNSASIIPSHVYRLIGDYYHPEDLTVC